MPFAFSTVSPPRARYLVRHPILLRRHHRIRNQHLITRPALVLVL
jgi:hypothetical protein